MENSDDKYYLHHEQIDSLPAEFSNIGNITAFADNMLYFKIKLEKDMGGSQIIVQEYHKGRREPYPKVIKVYEKQKVEIFDSKYYLSLYNT